MYKAQYRVSSDKSEFLTMQQCRERYQLADATIRKRAEECGASVKIGASRRFIKAKLDAYLSTFEA